jgi:hypothetical protein
MACGIKLVSCSALSWLGAHPAVTGCCLRFTSARVPVPRNLGIRKPRRSTFVLCFLWGSLNLEQFEPMMWDLFRKRKTSNVDRAPRLPVTLPVHFRAAGEFGWNVGKIWNISRSGILFGAGIAFPVNTAVEMQFTAPPDIGPKSGELVIARGKVVRTLMPASSDQRPALAAKFVRFEAVHQKNDW